MPGQPISGVGNTFLFALFSLTHGMFSDVFCMFLNIVIQSCNICFLHEFINHWYYFLSYVMFYLCTIFVANISFVWVIVDGIAAQKCGSPPPAHHPPVMLRSVSMSGAMSSSIGTSVGDSVLNEIATARRTKPGISRQDSRLSVKSLIESIENATKQAKTSKGMCVLFYVCIYWRSKKTNKTKYLHD